MALKMKVLLVGLAAATAIGAIGVIGSATASGAPEFHFEAEHTIVTGNQTTSNELSLDVGTMKCGVVKYAGTSAVQTTTTLTLNPTFENCKIGEAEVTVTLNGCHFLVHVGTNEEHLTGVVDLLCPDFPIEIDAPNCTVTIPEQLGLKDVTFTNEGEATTRSVVLDLGLGGIDYREHGMGCPNETVTTNNGTFTGKATLTGESTAGAHRGIWVE